MQSSRAFVQGVVFGRLTVQSTATPPSRLLDGPGTYRLVGIVSHMGGSTACGHYVAHAVKEGRWVIFNDEKVRGAWVGG